MAIRARAEAQAIRTAVVIGVIRAVTRVGIGATRTLTLTGVTRVNGIVVVNFLASDLNFFDLT